MFLFKFIIILFLLFPFTINAAGIAVSPAKINIELLLGQEKTATLEVENVTSSVALYEIWIDEFSELVKIKPESFTLESGENKKVSLTLKGKSEGQLVTTLSLISRPLGVEEFQLLPGVKIPLTITVNQTPRTPLNKFVIHLIITLILITILFWLVILILSHHKKRKIWQVFKMK